MTPLRTISVLVFLTLCANGQDYSLRAVESRAVARSGALEARRQDETAAGLAADAARGDRRPNLAVEGAYRYVTELPQPAFAPPGTEFGSHHNYNVGLTLRQTIWDQGSARRAGEALASLRAARGADRDYVAAQVLLATRVAYIQLLLAMEQLHLVDGSKALAARQAKDVEQRAAAGAASRMDVLNARQEVNRLESRRLDAVTAIRAQWLDLVTLTGDLANAPKEPGEIALDPIDGVVQALQAATPAASVAAHPRLAALEAQAAGLSLQAKSARSRLWPRLDGYARTSLEYPNGPEIVRVWQNAVGVNLAMPIFDWGQTRARAGQKEAEAGAARALKSNANQELRRDLEKALVDVAQTSEKIRVAGESRAMLADVAVLTEKAYKAGRLEFTDVLAANLRSFESKVDLLRLIGNQAVAWASYRSLAGEERKSP